MISGIDIDNFSMGCMIDDLQKNQINKLKSVSSIYYLCIRAIIILH